MTTKPGTDEYAPYYGKYVTLVPEGDIVATLASQINETLALLRAIPEEKGCHAYAPGKWSIKQSLGHLIDTERIMAYRALRIARHDKTALAGFEQDDFVAHSDFNARTLADLIEEFAVVRQATLHLLKHLRAVDWEQMGTASENPVTARALAYIIAGHELYHRELFTSRYLA